MTRPQEPRTGGVHMYAYEAPDVSNREGKWFPLAEAEALIDPNDPAVRERLLLMFNARGAWNPDALTDAVLAALRSES